MARRRIHDSEVIEIDYNGRKGCHDLKLKARSLTALKRKIDKLDSVERKVSVPVTIISNYGSTDFTPARIVMIAKSTDWEKLRYDEKPELLSGLHNRQVPTVWIMKADGNQQVRAKVRLDECAFPSESLTATMREFKRIGDQIKELQNQRKSLIEAIPRLALEDIQAKGAEEEALDDE